MKWQRLFLALLGLKISSAALGVPSDYPEWWYELGLVTSGKSPGNTSAVNQGQLKNMAVRARAYLQHKLDLDGTEWDAEWQAAYSGPYAPAPGVELFTNTGNNWVVVNQGQAKHSVLGFYNILLSRPEPAFNNTKAMLAKHHPSGWIHDYPWDSSVGDTAHWSPLLIGQLKFMFAFELGEIGPVMDVDKDGFDDRLEWRVYNGLQGLNVGDSVFADANGNLMGTIVETLNSLPGAGDTYGDVEDGITIVLPDRGVYGVVESDLSLIRL